MASQLWMTGHRVELPEMLTGRENRARKQKELHEQYPGTLVCFTLNIAGPIKVFALSMEVFENTDAEIQRVLADAGFHIRHHEMDRRSYGWESYTSVDGDALDVKRVLLDLEEHHTAGRLFDIDVLRPDGSKVSREDFGLEPRSCLVCGQPTIGCARSRAHTVEQIQDKTTDLFLESLRDASFTPLRIARLCCQAMLLEVYTTPKPGLVDRHNNGAHQDMNVELFERSTAALENYFAECAEAGMTHKDTSASELLSVIRPLGIVADKTMFLATGGVNTHKGMIFSMGILACATGWVLANASASEASKHADGHIRAVDKNHGKDVSIVNILHVAGEIAQPAWENDLTDLDAKQDLTAGEQEYVSYGIGGIRREAAMGFPSVRNISWPKLCSEMEKHGQWELAGMRALMELIAHVTDTNIIHRSSVEVQEQVHRELKAQILKEQELTVEQVAEWDQRFIEWNISPGGCADLLALTYYLYSVSVFLNE